MIYIGEKINAVNPKIYKLIQEKNKEAIQEIAKKQAEAGADYLDLNVGTAWLRPAEVMVWLVEIVQEAVEIPLAIDSRKFEVIEAGLKVCRQPALINSTTGEKGKLDRLMPLAAEYKASLVGLTMYEQGIPPHTVGRVAIAKRIMNYAENYGISRDRIFIDPVLLPLRFSHSQGVITLETIKQVALEKDPPHLIVGLSNASQGAKGRKLINRIFLVMAIACGLDAVIADVLDTDLKEAALAAEAILGRHPEGDRFFRGIKKLNKI